MKFAELIGQGSAIRQIRESLESEKLAHAILLRGPDGIGKLAFATALAQYVNCDQPVDGDSCGRCVNCIKISKYVHPDIRYVFPVLSNPSASKPNLCQDHIAPFLAMMKENPWFGYERWKQELGGENKQLSIFVDEIRDLKRKIYLKVAEGRTKVVIVWNADRINRQGANAFLKLLEEPPDKTLLILTTSHPSQMLTTVLSRCQQVRLDPLSQEEVSQFLIDRKELEPDFAREIAGISEGSISTALGYLNDSHQAMKQVLTEWLRALYTGNYEHITEQNENILSQGRETQKFFLRLAIKTMRNALLFSMGLKDLALADRNEREFQQKFSQVATPAKVDFFRRELDEAQRQISGNANGQMVFSSLSMRLHRALRT